MVCAFCVWIDESQDISTDETELETSQMMTVVQILPHWALHRERAVMMMKLVMPTKIYIIWGTWAEPQQCFSSSHHKRLSCLSHTHQFAVQTFDTIHSSKWTVKKAHKVKKVLKSTKATERLNGLCGVKLIADCPTCWNSTYIGEGTTCSYRGSAGTWLG